VIVYFDTSAFVPLLVEEVSSEACKELWNDAHSVVTVRIMYAEAAAALAQGVRAGHVTPDGQRRALAVLDQYWTDFEVVDVDDSLVRRAATLTSTHSLRGYDAVHVAAAELLGQPEVIVAAGDKRMLAACAALGMATADPNNLDA
jgi:predicted nucleic acid-binding protein